MTPGPGQGTSKRRHLGPRYWSLANVSKAEKQKEAGVSREWPPRLQTITLSHRETDSDSRTGGEDQHISSFSHYCPLSLSLSWKFFISTHTIGILLMGIGPSFFHYRLSDSCTRYTAPGSFVLPDISQLGRTHLLRK